MAQATTSSLPKGAKKVSAKLADTLKLLKLQRDNLNSVKRDSDDTRKQILDELGDEEAILYYRNEVIGSIEVSESEVLDTAKLRLEQPEIYNAYLKPSKRVTVKVK
jgi:ribosomal protein L30/L7E